MQSQPIPSFPENGHDEICLRACSTGTGRLEAARERNVLKKRLDDASVFQSAAYFNTPKTQLFI